MALVVTSLLRERIRLTAWRLVHWTAYACWPIAVVHGLGTGSDGRLGWVQGLYVVATAAVVGAVGWRLAATRGVAASRRLLGAVAAAVLVLAVTGWALQGPAHAGWARRAGTPKSMLGGGGGH